MGNIAAITWTGAFETPEFSKIDDTEFEQLFAESLAKSRAEIDAIAQDPSAPSFENTIVALEREGNDLGKLLSVFYTLAGTDSTDLREELSRKFSPELAKLSSEITLNPALFARVNTLWKTRETLDLTNEQLRVLTLTYDNFKRAGAALEGQDRARYAEIKERLSIIGTAFGQNLLADERDWSLDLAEGDLAGLPEFVIDAARAAGTERNAAGPVLTLSRSLVVPFLQFSTRRDLREIAYKAWTARGASGGETNNVALAKEMLELRAEMAGLLGYKSFADFKLEMEMAKTPERVEELLHAVWQPAKAAADADADVLEAMLQADGINDTLAPWDWHHYAQKRRKAEHDLDEEELKPYFQLDQMIEAAFDCATRLFGLAFEPLKLDLYHADCRAWQVSRDGQHIAVFIGDYFARGGKRSGAWCSAMRSQNHLDDERPIVMNVCNFAKPPKGKPELLSYDDARTLFHEFGHALHQMLSDVTYSSISGTSVPRDFVELPSQLYEHWLDVPEVLSRYAVHAETGEPIPQDLLQRLIGANTFDIGFQTVEYVASALVDLEMHRGEAPSDPMAFQKSVLDKIGMPRAISMRHATPHFAHVFSGGYYAASYYSYMWSEVMDADAFAAFEEAGSAFDAGTAQKLEEFILSKGGSIDPAELYTSFRGRLPGVEALLKGRGLNKAA
ncbi:MAG: M3 family metallopeptidase [Pseudomonadota bacterium]